MCACACLCACGICHYVLCGPRASSPAHSKLWCKVSLFAPSDTGVVYLWYWQSWMGRGGWGSVADLCFNMRSGMQVWKSSSCPPMDSPILLLFCSVVANIKAPVSWKECVLPSRCEMHIDYGVPFLSCPWQRLYWLWPGAANKLQQGLAISSTFYYPNNGPMVSENVWAPDFWKRKDNSSSGCQRREGTFPKYSSLAFQEPFSCSHCEIVQVHPKQFHISLSTAFSLDNVQLARGNELLWLCFSTKWHARQFTAQNRVSDNFRGLYSMYTRWALYWVDLYTKQKHPVSSSSAGRNALLMSQCRRARLIKVDSNTDNVALEQWYAEEHLWTHNVSKADRLQQYSV